MSFARVSPSLLAKFETVLENYALDVKPSGLGLSRLNSYKSLMKNGLKSGYVFKNDNDFLTYLSNAAFDTYQQNFTGSRLAKKILGFVGKESGVKDLEEKKKTKKMCAGYFFAREALSIESNASYFERIDRHFNPGRDRSPIKVPLAHGVGVSASAMVIKADFIPADNFSHTRAGIPTRR